MGMSASLVGATGLVGQELLRQLVHDAAFDRIHVVARRALPAPDLALQNKVVAHVLDFDRLDHYQWPACEILFCCLGTTIKKAGSQSAFRLVDLQYVLASAQAARAAGATSLVVISAMGADAASRVFYSRVKGEMEQAVATLGFDAVTIVRPALLAGQRIEHRAAERFALAGLKFANPLLPRKYRSIPAAAVARAMIASGKESKPGLTIIESDRLQDFV